MGVVSTNTMVTGTTGGGFIGYFRNQAGSMSPTTTDAIGSTPTIDYVSHLFGFTVIQLLGNVDNSSITGMILTPSGGSAITFTFNSYVQDGSVTRFASGSGSNLSSGTTYTVQLLGSSTNVNTEGVTLERRNPKKMSDFYGATRNVPPVSGAFKLSWLKNAVKYQFSSAMSIAYQPGQFVSHTGFSTTIYAPQTLGSMADTSVDSIINFYNGATVTNFVSINFPSNPSVHIFSFTMSQTATSNNSQWYKVSFTPSGGSEVAFYREDLTYTRSGTDHNWVANFGTPPFSAGSGTFKLTC